jgi:tRNA(Ile)-lysidine synthase
MDSVVTPGSNQAWVAASSSLPVELGWPLLEAACAQALAAQGRPIAPGGLPSTLLIGLSGGVDSVVLLALAIAWQRAVARSVDQSAVAKIKPLKLRVVALHAHHGLQAPADAWLQDCVTRCAALGIELISTRLALGPQQRSEAAARAARYDFFRRQLHGPHDCLLLAHHADDQAETLLLRVAQGRAVQGMPRFRSLGPGLLVRPLLDQRRKALEDYARRHQLHWVEDPTNTQLVADRNFVRHQWLPAAMSRWPDLVPSLAGLADRQRQQAELLVELVASWSEVPVAQAQLDTGPSLLRAWLRSQGEASVTHLALQEFCAQLASPPDRNPSLRLAQGELRRYASAIHYVTEFELAEVALAAHYDIASPGQLRLPHGVLSVSGPVAQLQVRFAQSLKGSLFVPPVRGRYWQQARVPPWARGSFPQLFSGDQRLGLPVCGEETLMPSGLGSKDPGSKANRWVVLWEPLAAGSTGKTA